MSKAARIVLIVALVAGAVAVFLIFQARTGADLGISDRSREASQSPASQSDAASSASGDAASNAAVFQPRSGSGVQGSTGYRAMSPAVEERLAQVAVEVADSNPIAKGYLDRMRSEQEDPEWSSPTEANLSSTMVQNGARLTGLEVSQPDCKSSVCMLTAAGGATSDAANADFQGLMGSMYGQQWFRDNFKDQSTTVKLDKGRVVYITYFERK